jgi:hypothetical protein
MRRDGSGLGPFSGAQLTVIVVTLAIVIGLPTAAIAAGSVFSSNSNGTPAVKGVNTGSNGVGVVGKGANFGVFSNGRLGVADGKNLFCKGCITPKDLSEPARDLQVLPHGKSESGVFGAGGGSSTSGQIIASINYARPLARSIPASHVVDAQVDPDHCPGPGDAARGYLCLYGGSRIGLTYQGAQSDILDSGSVSYGANTFWTVLFTGSYISSSYTVTAP